MHFVESPYLLRVFISSYNYHMPSTRQKEYDGKQDRSSCHFLEVSILLRKRMDNDQINAGDLLGVVLFLGRSCRGWRNRKEKKSDKEVLQETIALTFSLGSPGVQIPPSVIVQAFAPQLSLSLVAAGSSIPGKVVEGRCAESCKSKELAATLTGRKVWVPRLVKGVPAWSTTSAVGVHTGHDRSAEPPGREWQSGDRRETVSSLQIGWLWNRLESDFVDFWAHNLKDASYC